MDLSAFIEVTGSVLLFLLVFGMSGTVDIGCLFSQLHNRKAIGTGILLQFLVLPFLGFLVVKTLRLNHAMGITLLVVTSSPGGSYSNWWCSMFNADLALSVTMTAISTLMSIFTLPINLLIYARLTYNDDVIAALDWKGLFISLSIVILAITLGLFASYRFNSHNFNLHANRLGNAAGIALIFFSAFLSNSDADTQIWDRDWRFFLGVAAPCLLGLLVANIIATSFALLKPERVTVSIECVYQNVGIATSVALTMFDGAELSEAMGVPFFYGCMEAAVLSAYCIGAWKCGWTKAPADVSLWTSIYTSYEILSSEQAEKEQSLGVEMEHSQYVEHSEMLEKGKGVVGGNVAQDPATADHDAVDGLAAVRRQPIPNKGLKEPSYIKPPSTPTRK